ncbi:PqiC family protein [Acinetobacter sp. DSM 11652]|uniref:PqiC family protein n=1 Tax=Acinetobacter sp. DSM 11652 TaxID=346222 RepID=UPI0008C86370|nr:PqiC family protein [Acinetobacter sp. DSM 11652]SEM19046.1 hypothetical protein SAMN05216500_11358 [Acinetobacter sp. DSM 11652]
MTENKLLKTQQRCYLKVLSSLSVGLFALIVSGCSSSPTPKFYSLSTQTLTSSSSNQKVRMIEVLPVGLSDRLNRIPLVIQQENGQAKVLFDDRWTSTLSAELRDAVSARLQQTLGAVDRYNSGMTGGQAAYRIALDFSNFDFIEKSNQQRFILMNTTWTLRYDDPNRPLSIPKNAQTLSQRHQLSCRMSFYEEIPQKSRDLNTLVTVSQKAIDQLSISIASSVKHLENRNQPITGGVCS